MFGSVERGLLGARCARSATAFTVWAPTHDTVDLVIADSHTLAHGDIRPLTRDERGYWSGEFEDVRPGTLYKYRLNHSPDYVFPDPASRFQPRGVHGPSQVVDPTAYEWTDHTWKTPSLEDLVIYELHVGTFAGDGTFDAVTERLTYLSRLGVTAIELMPIGDFAGAHNWGYDGAALFAPARCYGTPESLRALVDAAHREGLAVVLDVVYNHFGPDGAYAAAFSPYYFSDWHKSPWGRGLNFDGPHSAEVRRFFIENALQWVVDYHIDALRLDATHAMFDESRPHFLAELTSVVRAEARREVLFTAEDHRNMAVMLQPVHTGGFGVDAVWADDFHHQARVHIAGDRDGYYADYSGSIADLVATLKQGWFYTGQTSGYMREPRGTDPSALDLPQFVVCIQNHDQVGNRFDGARLHHQIDPAAYRALTVLLLLAPHTPLLFMGQEWAASTPFQFFTDHREDLGQKVAAGRRAEFASFESFAAAGTVPDPQEHATFLRSRLRWDEIDRAPHAAVLRLYQHLLDLRRSHPALLARDRQSFDAGVIDDHTLWLRRSTTGGSPAILAVARLSGGEAKVPVESGWREVVLTTEDLAFVDAPHKIAFDREGSVVEFSRPGAILVAT